MKYFFKISAVTILTIVLILFFSSKNSPMENQNYIIVFPDGYKLTPLIADNDFEAQQGLSGKENPTSMLFLFENKRIVPIWMKDMSFPIDIIWIDGQTIVGFETEVPIENPPVTIYRSTVQVDRVLEVPAGFTKEHNLAVGNQLDIEFGKE
jgi:uncharacterized membrane protein (UPF0127 family)